MGVNVRRFRGAGTRHPATPAGWLDDRALTSHPRYRASERRGILGAVRAGAITIAVIQLVDAALLGPETPDLLVINLPIALLAVGLLHVMRQGGGARRRPIAGVFLLGAIAFAATLLPIWLIPALAPRMVAYLPILVVASALFVPWSVRWHLPWLALVLVAVAALDASPLAATLAAEGLGGLFPITLAGAITSFAGHAILQRDRRRAFAQATQLRQLNQAARQHRRELQALADQLEAVAWRDPLTGIGNRLRLDEDMGAFRTSLSPAGRPTAAILLDIDHFKDYNDEHGHLAGDGVLREVARTIAINLRPADRVYRFGGEEFLVLLVDTDAAGAGVAERILEAVLALAIPSQANRPWGVVSVSAGVASVRPDAPRDEWIREADLRLSASKAAGRNRVTGPADPLDGGRTGSASAA